MGEIEFYPRTLLLIISRVVVLESGVPPPSVFHMLEKNVGRRVLVIVEPQYGYEGVLAAVTHEPPGIWLSNAEAVILRATIAQPFPQVVSKENRSEIFVNVRNIQRLEVLHKSK
jgi:hypothetical protein